MESELHRLPFPGAAREQSVLFWALNPHICAYSLHSLWGLLFIFGFFKFPSTSCHISPWAGYLVSPFNLKTHVLEFLGILLYNLFYNFFLPFIFLYFWSCYSYVNLLDLFFIYFFFSLPCYICLFFPPNETFPSVSNPCVAIFMSAICFSIPRDFPWIWVKTQYGHDSFSELSGDITAGLFSNCWFGGFFVCLFVLLSFLLFSVLSPFPLSSLSFCFGPCLLC